MDVSAFRTTKRAVSMTALVFSLERAMGVEPTSKAWEAFILPMNYARSGCYNSRFGSVCQMQLTPQAGAWRGRA